MGNISNVIDYCMYDKWERDESRILACLFAWASEMNPSNDETMIMYYTFDEKTRTVSKRMENFSVLYQSLNDTVNHGYFYKSNIRDCHYSRREVLLQVVECITNFMPYNIVLASASAGCAKELFLLMKEYPDYSFCFDVAKNLYSEMGIRELRKAILTCNAIGGLNQESVKELFDILRYGGWFVLSSVCTFIKVLESVKAGLDKYYELRNYGFDAAMMAEEAINMSRKKYYKGGIHV